MSYADTPPSIQAQMERDAGFTPASDEERAAHAAAKADAKSPSGKTPAKGKKPKAKAPTPDAETPAAPTEEQEPPLAA